MLDRMYSLMCERCILPVADMVTGRSISRHLKFLEESQFWTREQLVSYQTNRLREVLCFAYNKSGYYKELFDDHRINPQTADPHTALRSLPLLTKKIIREKGIPRFIQGEYSHLIHERTSGSSGEQGEFYLSREAQSFTIAAELLFFKWGGYRLGDRHFQTGMTLQRSREKRLKDVLFRCVYAPAFDLTDQNVQRYCDTIARNKIRILIGYASSLYCIAEYANRYNIDLRGVESIISLGDTLYDHYRVAIESFFGCTVTDTYGCCEGFQVAGQCEKGTYHVCMPLNLVEILDSHNRPVPEGEVGKVVLTRLDYNPMPLIRYEVGDLAVMSKKEGCACGRGFQILDSIQGRDTDIITSKNHKLIVHFFTVIFGRENTIKQFQVIQEHINAILIKVVPADGLHSSTLDAIKRTIEERCEGELEVSFQVVPKIPASASGKRRFVISKIKF